MRAGLCALAVLVFFLSSVNAELAWKFATGGEVGMKPLFQDGTMVFGSADGSIYFVSSQSGVLIKKQEVGREIRELKGWNAFLIGSSGSEVVILDGNGTLLRTFNESIVYGIAAADKIYATTSSGMKAYNYDGTMAWTISERETMTKPLVSADSVVYGSGSTLVVLDKNGTIKNRIRVAEFWKSKPAMNGNFVYIGSNDGNMYAIDISRGEIIWNVPTNGWVMSDPLYSNGTIYFGSNDGFVYAVRSDDGKITWKRDTSDAVQGALELAAIAGRDVVVAGSNTNKAYAIDAKTGEVVLSYPAGGRVNDPTLKNNMLFFGSGDGFMYGYRIDRSCTIESPAPGAGVGYKSFTVSGKVYSQYGGPRVQVRINNGTWKEARVSGSTWSTEVDPNTYEFGPVFIECKALDSNGEEKGGFSNLVILRDKGIQKDALKVEIKETSLTAGKEFQVRATEEGGAAVLDFQVAVAGKTFYSKNGVANVRVDGAGSYDLAVKKVGYNDGVVKINVGYDLGMVGLIAGVIIVVALVAFYLFVYRKRF